MLTPPDDSELPETATGDVFSDFSYADTAHLEPYTSTE